jgi:putative transposase
MKSSRYSPEQVAFAMRQAESGTPAPEVCRKKGIAEQAFYRWKKKYSLQPPLTSAANSRRLAESAQ